MYAFKKKYMFQRHCRLKFGGYIRICGLVGIELNDRFVGFIPDITQKPEVGQHTLAC